jgi:hypothetical protein
MRALMIGLAFALGLMLTPTASAQSFPPGPWRGVWTTPEHYEYQAELDFTVAMGGQVTGQIRWMLVQSPQHEQQTKIGMRGVEYVEGTFSQDYGILNLRGVRVDDPQHVIGPDQYRFAVSPNGQYLVGMSANNGAWDGRIELTRFGPN